MEPEFRVHWWDWRGHHDWIGPKAPKRGTTTAYRRKAKPPEQTRDFLTRQGAEDFVAKQRRDIPEDELVVEIRSLRDQPTEPVPVPLLLPGTWPYQRRGA
jgi:hypothetical protein